MATASVVGAETPPVNDTLRRVVVTYRLLVLVWLYLLTGWTIFDGEGETSILVGMLVLGTVWAGVTVWAGRSNERLGSLAFVLLDALVALVLSAGSWWAGLDDFVQGGWPGSWLFVVAFASNLRVTIAASLVLVVEHSLLHLAMGLTGDRVIGTVQFIVIGFIIGWAFDALRERERLRLELAEQLAVEREALEKEREAAARHEERAALANHLHDDVLQTLHAIDVHAEEPSQVRYFVRRQMRELRRTIAEFRSPYDPSFQASLLRCRDEVEDLFRQVKINEVIRSDAEVTAPLDAALAVAREAMMNSAKHSGSPNVDLYSVIENGLATISVRDRGRGFDPETAPPDHLFPGPHETIDRAGGEIQIRTRPGSGTQVTITVPVT